MKVKLSRIEKDGTTIDYVLQFENGLKLRTYLNLSLADEEADKSVRTNIVEVLKELYRCGFELDLDDLEAAYGNKATHDTEENQVTILNAFQKADWPDFIENPLPPDQNLEATVEALNEVVKNSSLRFLIRDGRVGWMDLRRKRE